MLRELRIENLLLIERAELRLGEGLNAITGETGAGKTVLAHSLDLLMGGKARPQIVRPGAEEAWVEGVFDLPDGLLAEPEMAEIAERLPGGLKRSCWLLQSVSLVDAGGGNAPSARAGPPSTSTKHAVLRQLLPAHGRRADPGGLPDRPLPDAERVVREPADD